MKRYIIMVRGCDCEGRTVGFPEIYKIFLNKKDAEKCLKEKENAWAAFWMEEKEAE